ncbi:MAG: acyltransferase [Microscillaceae bacterium]|nr:acyltransferase [Microscillaceae bacterium]
MGLLRFLLAVSVVIVHSSPVLGFKMMEGFIAVQAFYIVSGFYMTLILNEKYIGKKSSYWLFISNRYLRLYPIYFVIVLMTILLSLLYGFLLNDFGKLSYYLNDIYSMKPFTLLVLLFSNLTLIGQDILSFTSYQETQGTLHFADLYELPTIYSFMFISIAWTVSLELNFYLIAPFVVRKSILRPLLVLMISILIRILFYQWGYDRDPWIYRFFPTEVLFFMLGSLSYHLYKNIPERIRHLHKIFFVLLIIFTLSFYYLPTYYVKIFTYYFLVMLGIPFLFKLTKNHPIDRYIGELSYPIYLVHPLVLMITLANRFPKLESLGTTTLILTLIMAILLHELIAKPLEKYRQSRINKTNEPVSFLQM